MDKDNVQSKKSVKVIYADFILFIKSNAWIVVLATISGLIVYGARIFSDLVGIDSDVYMSNPYEMVFDWNLQEGRFGITLIVAVFARLLGLNSFAYNLIALLFLIVGCVLWCFLIKRYDCRHSVNSGRNNWGIAFFVLIFMSSTVWLEIVYFTYMSAPCMIGFAMMPIAVFLMWEGIKGNNSLKILAIVILTIGASTYQMMFALFFAGIMIVFLLESDSSYMTKAEQRHRFISIITCTIISIIAYFVLNFIVSRLIFGISFSSSIVSMVGGDGTGIKRKIVRILYTLYRILIGNNYATSLFYDNVLKNPNRWPGNVLSDKIEDLTSGGWIGNILFLVALVFFLAKIIKSARKKSFSYFIATLGLLFSTIAICLLGGGGASDRYLHAVPLVAAFLVYDMMDTLSDYKRWYIIGVLISLVFTTRQLWSSSMLMDSDVKIYRNEVRFCQNVNSEIIELWGEKGIDYNKESNNIDNPILVIGNYEFSDDKNCINNGIIGVAAVTYGSDNSKIESTLRLIPFMRLLGYYYTGIDEDDERLDDLRKYAEDMACYPNKGFVQVKDGVTVIKLSDLAYTRDGEDD